MEANPGKFQYMLLSNSKNKNSPFELVINDIVIKGEESVKLLGVYIDKKLNFHERISYICRKAGAQLNALSRISQSLDQRSKLSLVRCFIISHFQYCPTIWHFCTKKIGIGWKTYKRELWFSVINLLTMRHYWKRQI